MGDFCFVGAMEASKSVMNRALVIQSFKPDIEIQGEALADDICHMKSAIKSLQSEQPIDCGNAGTVLRFMALRVARIPGRHILTGSKRLFARPHEELLRVLQQLGCSVDLSAEALGIESDGWHMQGDALSIQGAESSQVASGLFLSAWGLKQPLHVHISKSLVSASYFEMTVDMLREFGMDIFSEGEEWTIPPEQIPMEKVYEVESDVSSSFAVAAMAAVGGDACIRNFPADSLQPDSRFIQDFIEMGIPVRQTEGELRISRVESWRGISADLKNSPDLFPVLSVLCALASESSYLKGITHIAYKESNRIKKTEELLTKMGAQFVRESEDAVRITPTQKKFLSFDFNPDKDHRMAMAAAVAKKAGYLVKLKTPDVVRKSFPQFWQISGGVN